MAHLSSRFLVMLTGNGITLRFQTLSGAGIGGDAMMSRPPGAEYERAQGGEKTLNPITLGVDYDPSVHTDAVMAALRSGAHEENEWSLGRRPLDTNRHPFGKGTTWTGLITGVSDPDSDTNSQNDKATLTVTFQPSSVT